jgi:hypothetical protein
MLRDFVAPSDVPVDQAWQAIAQVGRGLLSQGAQNVADLIKHA